MINIKKIFKFILYTCLFFILLIFSPFFGLIGAMLLDMTITVVIIAIALYFLRAVYLAFMLIRSNELITLRKVFNIQLKRTKKI